MKKIYFLLLTLIVSAFSFGQTPIITAIVDGDCSGGNPKLLEIYADGAVDFSLYSIENQTNSNTSWGSTQSLAALGTVTNDFVYVTTTGSAAAIASEFPSITAGQTLTSGTINLNGDDRIRIILTSDSSVIDQYGAEGTDGTGSTWEYADSYAKRVNGNGPNATFTESEWSIPGAGTLNTLGTCQGGADTFETLLGGIGTYTTTMPTTPTISISSPSDNQIFPTGTTNADVSINVQNFVIGNPGAGIDGHIHWTLNGVNQPMKYDVLDEAITTVDGGTYVVVMTLVDNSHTPISPLVTDTVTFTVAFPCTLNVSTPVVTCNTITPATTDTYDVSIDYTGGGNSTYTIDTAGNGTLGGDNPSSVASGTILISGITEDTDFTVTFTGDPADSGCDFTRNISSPNCDPQLMLPILEDFAYTDGSLTSNPNWTGFSGTDGDLLVSNEKAVVQHGVPDEDASIAFTSVPGDIYYALDFSITDPGGIITGGDYEYFAVFKDDGFNFRARLDVTDATNGGDFSVGLSSSTSTATAIWATDLAYGTTYRATVRYNQTDGVSQLWIDAAASTDPSISSTGDVTTITQFALRQSDSSLNEAVLVDNLSITTTFNETLSTGEFTTNTEFRLFPNPTNTGIVNITTTSNEAINVTVFDILGKQVLSQTVNNTILNVSSLNAGVYILKLNQNGATTTKKLVIK